MWIVAVAMFTSSSLLAFMSETSGWSTITYQVYYFSLSPMVAFMGVGTLYLLADKSWAKYFLTYTIILSLSFLILIFTTPIDTVQLTTFSPPSEIGSTAISGYPKLLSPLLSIPGGLVLIGGALYGFWIDRSRKYTLLIGIGGIIQLASGFRARFGGDPTYFFLFTTVGVLFLFLGFLLSSEYVKHDRK